LCIDCGAEQGTRFLVNMIVVTSTFFAVLRGREGFRKHFAAVAISLFSFLLIGILLFRLVDQERGAGVILSPLVVSATFVFAFLFKEQIIRYPLMSVLMPWLLLFLGLLGIA